MGFEEAVAHLDALGVDAMKSLGPSTHRIEAICEVLGHPENAVPAIHITGTNGKTSTARIAACILAATGLKVGTYTSPHLQSITERIAFNGEALASSTFGEVFDHLFPYLELVERELDEHLTYFEILTAMFFLWAADSVDAMVVEVGLGGRWDATNLMTNVPVAVVTNVGLDHMGMLGMDHQTIAKEKSGIVKPGATIVTSETKPDVLAIIDGEAHGAGAPVAKFERDFRVLDNALAVGGRYLTLRTSGRDYEGLFLPLHGNHQAINAVTALEAATTFFVDESLGTDVVREGFAGTVVPGRLETLHEDGDDRPPVVLDVAHNPDGMSALISSLLETFAFERAHFVVGILGDKDYRGMLAEIARVPGRIVCTEARTVRSVPAPELRAAAEEAGLSTEVAGSVEEGLDRALADAVAGELVCVTGSHYIVGEARTLLLG